MSWPPTGKKPDWMSDKSESEFFCAKHQCQKTPMVFSSFCSKCEAEQFGDKGAIQKGSDQYIDIGSEITIPDFKIIKDIALAIRLGQVDECYCLNTSHKLNIAIGFYQCRSCLGYSKEMNRVTN